jgi:hypothetical protein
MKVIGGECAARCCLLRGLHAESEVWNMESSFSVAVASPRGFGLPLLV